jgi:hypothetical protein
LPKFVVHAYVSRLFFGKSYWKVHREMDRPFKYLGRRHRILFHDFSSAYAIASELYPGDFNAVQAAWLHIHLDEQCSNDPELRRWLENLVSLDSTRRMGARRSGSRFRNPRLKAKRHGGATFQGRADSVSWLIAPILKDYHEAYIQLQRSVISSNTRLSRAKRLAQIPLGVLVRRQILYEIRKWFRRR